MRSSWIGLLCCIGCQVYDPGLLDERSQRRGIRADRAEQDASQSDDAAIGDAADSCGDGVVGEDEACDIAIARGKAGACPDGCSGGAACMRRVLEGEGCDARCVEREFNEASPDDGCCPAGTDYHEDNDCPARCGNGELEPGERCDPSDTCPREEACESSNDACERAEYVGAADSCNAHCEITTISSCRGGDGCCPPGCDAERDSDCGPTCPEGQTCPGGGSDTPVMMPPPPPPFDCNAAHEGSACRTCTCARCGEETEACLNDEASDASLCRAAIDCAEAAQCTGRSCYCANANIETCAMGPTGACKDEWRAAAQLNSPALVIAAMSVPSLTVGKATRLVECRARSCAEECGLVAR